MVERFFIGLIDPPTYKSGDNLQRFLK